MQGMRSLCVTTDAKCAFRFGIDAAVSEDDDEGPLVVAADLKKIVTVRGVELLPDEPCIIGYNLSLDSATWEDTAKLCGMFQIYGPIEAEVKSLFQPVPKPYTGWLE